MSDRLARDLRGPLAARLGPLLVAFGAVVATSAPIALHSVGARDLRASARASAEQVAEVLARDAEELPVLWRYDSIKLVEHLRAYRDRPGVVRIEAIDALGRPIDPAFTGLGDAPLLWESAPIAVHGRTVGTVWVAMDAMPLRLRALSLLGIFLALAALLSTLVYVIAMRSARAAESRIADLVETLSKARAEERLLDLQTRALALQEEERRAIGRDLHDTTGQALTAIRIRAQLLGERRAEPDEVARLAEEAVQLTDGALEEVRRVLLRLGPSVLVEIGLRDAITRLADDLAESASLAVQVRLDDATGLPAAIETAAYRIVQEALTNVARHARASRVTIELSRGERLTLVIEDDGPGIAPEAEKRGRGVVGMRERAELLGGRLAVDAVAPHGTRVTATFPLRPRD